MAMWRSAASAHMPDKAALMGRMRIRCRLPRTHCGSQPVHESEGEHFQKQAGSHGAHPQAEGRLGSQKPPQ